MDNYSEIIHSTYGNKIRVRACGILIKDNAILLVKHKGLGDKEFFWAPPGGGVEFGESIKDTIVREFKEECNIEIEVKGFITLTEFVQQPLHAIELFYEVKYVSGELSLGDDPELNGKAFFDIGYISEKQIKAPRPNESFHQICIRALNKLT